jgi:Flp pilus assembly protein TadD
MTDSLARQRQMVEQFPDNELARFSLGKGLFDQSNFQEARDHLEKALLKRPDWMVVQILIGKCALELGDRAAGRVAFERALALAIKQHHEGPQNELEFLLSELND